MFICKCIEDSHHEIQFRVPRCSYEQFRWLVDWQSSKQTGFAERGRYEKSASVASACGERIFMYILVSIYICIYIYIYSCMSTTGRSTGTKMVHHRSCVFVLQLTII